MLSNKDINFNDETQVLRINGENHPIGEAIAAKIGDLTETGVTGDSVAEQIEELNTGLTEAKKHTLKYLIPDAIDADDLAIGGVVVCTTYFSINKGCLGIGVCMDDGNENNYLIALLYRKDNNSEVKFVELAKNGLYISAINTGGTAAIAGNTGNKRAYTIVFK